MARGGLRRAGVKLLTDGTENHLVMVDLRPMGLTGRQAESALRDAGVTLNRNVIPGDPNGPWYTSGLRLGSAAVTTAATVISPAAASGIAAAPRHIRRSISLR